MTIPYSCPDWDAALEYHDKIKKAADEVDSFMELIREWLREAEDHIESAREINRQLRDENEELRAALEDLKTDYHVLEDERDELLSYKDRKESNVYAD